MCLLVSFDVWPCNWRFLEVTQWIIHTLFVSQFFAVARGLGRFQNFDLKGGFFGIFGLPLCFGCKTWGSLRDLIWDSFEDFQLGFLKAFGSWVNQPHLFKDPQSGPKSLILQGFFKVLGWMDPSPWDPSLRSEDSLGDPLRVFWDVPSFWSDKHQLHGITSSILSSGIFNPRPFFLGFFRVFFIGVFESFWKVNKPAPPF